MKNHFIKLTVIAAMLGGVATASADQLPQQARDHGMYWGMMWTPLMYGYVHDNSTDVKNDGGVFFWPASLQASLGYQFNRYIGLEGLVYTPIFQIIPTVAAKFILPFSQSFSLYAKGGVGLAIVSFSVDGQGGSASRVMPYAAAGMSIGVTPRTDLNLEGSAFFAKQGSAYFAEGLVGIGFTYHFS